MITEHIPQWLFSDRPCVILEISEIDAWSTRGSSGQVIPELRRPTVIHANRDIAETEAMRLSQALPGRRFLVLEGLAVAQSIQVPTHVNIRGEVKASRTLSAVMLLGDGVPF